MTAPTPARRPFHTLGPGTLTFGDVGSELDMSCQVTAVTVSAEASAEDAVTVLCGTEIPGDRTYAWTLAYTAYQDILTGGVIDYTWTNAGAQVPFTFSPDNTTDAKVTGVCIIDPVQLGGTVKSKNTSEVSWTCVGTPSFVADELESEGTTPAGT